tara:strand:- start:71 stop:388 length:318 start_codon:yes stop_codon:yes gene_type:complete
MSSELIQHWTGEWKIQNKKSDWNNTSISLIQQNFNTLKQKKKEDAQIWKIKVDSNNAKYGIFIVLKKNGRMKVYKGQMSETNNIIRWRDYKSNKIVDKWIKSTKN